VTLPQLELIAKDSCAWPNIFRLRDNSVCAVIFNKPSHGLEEGSLELWKKKKDSPLWSLVSTPAPCIPGQNRMHCSCGVSPSGEIHILSTGFSIAGGNFLNLEPIWHSRSTDMGKSWTIEKEVMVEGVETHSIPHGSILFPADNTILATVYRSHGKNNPSYTWCISSDNGGRTWQKHSLIGDGDTNEAYLVNHGGSLFAAVRTHVDHHTRLYCYLPSEGLWHDFGPLTLPMQHPGHLLTLDNGALLLTYGIRNKGLMGIGGRFSLDKGATWLPPFVLYRFPDETRDCGYPSSLQLDEDTLITACYTDVSKLYDNYHGGAFNWSISNYLSEQQLKSISDGKQMKM